MANSLTFTTPVGESVTFTLTAQADGSLVLYSKNFTTTGGGIYLKVFETGDSANPITDYSTMGQGELYDIEAYADVGFTTPADITTWGGTNVTFVGFTMDVTTVDRRPIFVGGYATATMTSTSAPTDGVDNSGAHWGVGTQAYRLTPAVGALASAFLDNTQNGKLKWVQDVCEPASNFGIERFSIWNPAGYTNYQDHQPWYPSNPYTAMAVTTADVFTAANTTIGAVTTNSPFTPNGFSGTRGDVQESWRIAIEDLKDAITTNGGVPEIAAYGGYRPLYTNTSMSTIDRTYLGQDPAWTGLAASPGYLPEPGFDWVDANNPGVSSSDDNFNDWFALELAGLHRLGFQGYGLDTGAKAWQHAEGMITGGVGNQALGARTGSSRLIDLFNSYGLRPFGESIIMDTYNEDGDPLTGADAAAYTNLPYMGIFNTAIGYTGLDAEGAALDITGSAMGVHNATAGDGTATIGPNANTFSTTTTEVHVIFRWDNTNEIKPIMDLVNGWPTLKQVMYDFHTAGCIVSVGGSVTASMTDGSGTVVTASDFYTFVTDLAAGTIATRPAPPVPPSGLQQTVTITCDAGGTNPGFSATGKDVWQDGWPGILNGGDLTWSFGEALLLDYPELYDAGTYSSTDGQAFVDKYDYRITKTVTGFPGEDGTQDYVGTLASVGGSAQPAYCRFEHIGALGDPSANGPTTWVIDVYAAGDLV